MHLRAGVILFLEVAIWHSRVFAGTVITSNLPPNTAIININGTQDFAANYDSDKGHWFTPASTLGSAHLLEYTFPPGTYAFRVVDPADAAQLFPALTPLQTNQIYTAWTFGSPWLTSYTVFDSAAVTNSSIPELFDGASGTNYGNGGVPLFGNASAAYNAAIAGNFYNLIRTGPAGYNSLNFTNRYAFTNTETLIFVIPDQGPGDNHGGVSVLVTPLSTDLAVNWFKVAAGGGASSDGTLIIKGTAGQPDAGAMTDGILTVKGGFWNVDVMQTPGLPVLTIHFSPGNAKIVWPSLGTYTLQVNNSLSPTGWNAYSGAINTDNGTNSVTVTAPQGNLFFRLKQ